MHYLHGPFHFATFQHEGEDYDPENDPDYNPEVSLNINSNNFYEIDCSVAYWVPFQNVYIKATSCGINIFTN